MLAYLAFGAAVFPHFTWVKFSLVLRPLNRRFVTNCLPRATPSPPCAPFLHSNPPNFCSKHHFCVDFAFAYNLQYAQSTKAAAAQAPLLGAVRAVRYTPQRPHQLTRLM